jgi:hypothetical protein
MATNISGTLGVDKIDPALIATTAEAQAGTDNTKLMTPSRVADVALGVGQTWQDVLSSRAKDTNYTNTTGKPIFVVVANTTSTTNLRITVDGITLQTLINNGISYVIVPNNSVYSVATGGTLGAWSELR